MSLLSASVGTLMKFKSLLHTKAPGSVLLIRVLVGWVFLSEGLQKFIFADSLGAGRFQKIGIAAPQFMAPFVGTVEIVCGALVIAGIATRLAAVPLLIDISVAIISTKIPILLGRGFAGFSDPKPPVGFWPMLHEARTDFSMLLGLLFVLIVGAGRLSFDSWLAGDDRHR